jgi:5'-3' exonuclease
MGIPYYVSSLLRRHKHIQQDTGNARLECEVLGLDFNSFIHQYLRADNPIGSVVVALRNLFRDVITAKKILIAFDGLVPYAKIVQQRYRRMRHQDVPAGPHAVPFDKHQISPGTRYMLQLEEALRMAFPQCEISGTNEKGEGEHKIFTWLKTINPNQRKTVVIYGLDADLILISVAQSSLGHIKLLREKQDGGFSTFSIDALKAALPIPADEWVELCVQNFGNDFMPTVAVFSLREDGYARALSTKKLDEAKVLVSRAKDTDRKIAATDGHALEARMSLHLMDGVLDWEKVVYAYWKTYEWTLHYFKTSEVLDWCWFYPYPEAPLLSIIADYERPTEFKWDYPEPPFTISDQLAFILPSSSFPGKPLYPDELYHEGLDSRHKWMKAYEWETDPYISLPWDPARPLTSISFVHP